MALTIKLSQFLSRGGVLARSVLLSPIIIACGVASLLEVFLPNQKVPKSDLRGKCVLITGPTSGVGRETAKRLAAMGAHIILACRSEAPTVEREILDANGSVSVLYLDLLSLKSVRNCARALSGKQIDICVLNAGINTNTPSPTHPDMPRSSTVFGVNFVAHFLLIRLLGYTSLRNTRIIALSSVMHHFALPSIMSFDSNTSGGLLSVLEADYSESKLAMNLLTNALAEARFFPQDATSEEGIQPIHAIAVNPGAVSSDIWRHTWGPVKPVLNIIMSLFFLSPDQGCATTIAASILPATIVPPGAYLSPYYQPRLPIPGRSGFEFIGPFAGARPAYYRKPHRENDVASNLWSSCEILCGHFLSEPL